MHIPASTLNEFFFRNKAIYCFGGDGDGGDGDDIDGGHEGRLRPSARHVRPSDAAAARPRVSFLFPSDFVIEKTQTHYQSDW